MLRRGRIILCKKVRYFPGALRSASLDEAQFPALQALGRAIRRHNEKAIPRCEMAFD
jgi:hypothetical protein